MNKLPDRIRIKDIARLADVSVGTVDRVIHGRTGVSDTSRKRVEEILQQLDYQPNMYASALASNKKYQFASLLPLHRPGQYWDAVEQGIKEAVSDFSDFHLSMKSFYYDPFDYTSFIIQGERAIAENPDGILISPTIQKYTNQLTELLDEHAIPYIYIDSYINECPPLAFFGQDSLRSGYFAARMLTAVSNNRNEVVIFRKINEGIIGSNQQKNREIGFREYMEEHFPSCKIHELNLHAKRPSEDTRLLDDFFTDHPSLTSGITFNSEVYVVGEYLQKQNKCPFTLIGYDLLERNVECLKSGTVTFLIAQQPEVQGYNGVKALCDHLIFKKEVSCINYMPIDFIAKENIDYYRKLQR